MSSRRTSSVPSTAAGLISWRVGPHWKRDEGFELVAPVGRRGEAEPAAGAGGCACRSENDTAGRWWHSSTTIEAVAVEQRGSSRRARLWIMATSITPVGLFVPPPIWPTSVGSMPRWSASRDRHWSTSSLRSTTTSVGVRWWAMTAHAMTVLPAPGGATSTPSSWSTRSATAVDLLRAQRSVESERRPVVDRVGRRSRRGCCRGSARRSSTSRRRARGVGGATRGPRDRR